MTILRSSVAALFVVGDDVKMASGFLWFQNQVRRRIRVPRWVDRAAPTSAVRIADRPTAPRSTAPRPRTACPPPTTPHCGVTGGLLHPSRRGQVIPADADTACKHCRIAATRTPP